MTRTGVKMEGLHFSVAGKSGSTLQAMILTTIVAKPSIKNNHFQPRMPDFMSKCFVIAPARRPPNAPDMMAAE